jgi:DNA polymerase
MLIGEAPGKEEDAKGRPFVGPAGRLLDQIWSSVGMNTNDWYISNVAHCRPIAIKGSGKENLTPKTDQIERCRIFIDEEIGLLKPKIIVTVGAIATVTLLRIVRFKMADHRGRLVDAVLGGWREHSTKVFPMIHPAALLHSKGNQNKYKMYKLQMWEDIQKLKTIMEEIDE